jgi:hypothetical protein
MSGHGPVCANGKTVLAAAQDWMDAARRGDLAAIAAGMAENCRRYGEPEWIVTQKPAYLEGYRQFLASFSDYRLDILNIVASGRSVVFELIESARFTGPYPLPDGRVIEPNGASYTDHACTWVEVGEAGLIREIRAYIPSTRGRLLAEALASNGC